MKILLSFLMLCGVTTAYADCDVDAYGRMSATDAYGSPCVQNGNNYSSNTNNNSYRREGNNLYGASVNNYQDRYNTYDNGRTWNPASPSSSSKRDRNSGLGVDTDVYTPNPYLNQNNKQQQDNNSIGWKSIY